MRIKSRHYSTDKECFVTKSSKIFFKSLFRSHKIQFVLFNLLLILILNISEEIKKKYENKIKTLLCSIRRRVFCNKIFEDVFQITIPFSQDTIYII